MSNSTNYDRELKVNTEESLFKISKKIERKSLVLDLGAGPGVLGRFLTRELDCIVDGVDINPDSIEKCRNTYRKFDIQNLEDPDLLRSFDIQTYDYVVIADVIEHLVDPDLLLQQVIKLVKPSGKIIFSVPNVSHISAGMELLFGKFNYTANGLLDSTHLRFYTLKSLLEKLKQFGLNPVEIDQVEKGLSETEFSTQLAKKFPSNILNDLVSLRGDSLTYQWIVTASLEFKKMIQIPKKIIIDNDVIHSRIYNSIAYFRTDPQYEFSPNESIFGRVLGMNEGFQQIEFSFPPVNSSKNDYLALRIDPIEEIKPFIVAKLQIFQEENLIHEFQIEEKHFWNSNLVGVLGEKYFLFEPTDQIPIWILPPLDENIRKQVVNGFQLRLSLLQDVALTRFLCRSIQANEVQVMQGVTNEIAVGQAQRASIVDHDDWIEFLKKRFAKILRFTSWQINRHFKRITWLIGRMHLFWQFQQKFRQAHTGIGGYARLLHLTLRFTMRNGFSGITAKLAGLDMPPSRLPFSEVEKRQSVLILEDSEVDPKINLKVGVHVHAYYVNLAEQIRTYLKNIPVPFTLFVTTDTDEKRAQLKEIFREIEQIKSLDVRVCPNRGRDLYPMIAISNDLVQFDLVLHLHTKKSPHRFMELAGWRRYLLQNVLGSPERVSSIFKYFVRNKNLGLLFPYYFHPIKKFVFRNDDSNLDKMLQLLWRLGLSKRSLAEVDRFFFPAGDFFWIRGEILKVFSRMKLASLDFETEGNQLNNTVAHAIERLFPFFAKLSGFESWTFLSRDFLSRDCSALPFSRLQEMVNFQDLKGSHIVFDHNGGGGTNVYTNQLIQKALLHIDHVLRIYFEGGNWIIQWVSKADGCFFYTDSIFELFSTLNQTGAQRIVVNSLYGAPDLQELVAAILLLSNELAAELDVKVHDFFVLCASPHLLDHQNKYCGVPQDHSICKGCLKLNKGWYHSWFPSEHIPLEISDWRKPFQNLVARANSVTFFDQSSVDIFKLGLEIEQEKIRVVPHSSDYFQNTRQISRKGPLHLGFIGTLTHVKGAEKFCELHNYIQSQSLEIPMTVVGSSYSEVPPKIHVTGPYDQVDLPEIIVKTGINVVLMLSIVPETFSFTISEAISLNLGIVAFDIGAQGNRVKNYELGQVVPLNSSSQDILLAAEAVYEKRKRK